MCNFKTIRRGIWPGECTFAVHASPSLLHWVLSCWAWAGILFIKGLNGVHCLLNQQVVCCIQTLFRIFINSMKPSLSTQGPPITQLKFLAQQRHKMASKIECGRCQAWYKQMGKLTSIFVNIVCFVNCEPGHSHWFY